MSQFTKSITGGSGTGEITVDADSGSATSVSGVINIIGSGSTSTSASGDTVVVHHANLFIDITATTKAMVVSEWYMANNAGLVTFTLPVTCTEGTRMKVAGKGAGGWKIAQNASQYIKILQLATTTGTGGSVASTDDNDYVEILCTVADTEWVALGYNGNITVT